MNAEVNLDFFNAAEPVADTVEEAPSQSTKLIMAMAGISEKIDNFKASIRAQLDEGVSHCLTYSGGKDSSVTLTLALDVIADYKKRGGVVPRFAILHGDTLVENPEVSRLTRAEIKKIEQFLIDNDLEDEGSVHIATPSLASDYIVSIIGGRSMAIMPDNPDAKCSTDLKINPMNQLKNKIFKDLKKSGSGKIVTVIGTRSDESVARGNAMAKRGESATQAVMDKNGNYVLSPIMDFTLEDVFLIFDYAKSGDVNAYSDLQSVLDLYGAAAEPGSCSLAAFTDTDTTETCGGVSTARFGCFSCFRVSRDRSLSQLSNVQPYLKALNEWRDYVRDTHYDPSKRNWLARTLLPNGKIRVAANSYAPFHVEDLIRYAITIDMREKEAAAELGIEPRFEIITKERLCAIELNWQKYGYHRGFEAFRIYREIEKGARYDIPTVKEPHKALPKVSALELPFVDEEYHHAANGFLDVEQATSGLNDTISSAQKIDDAYIQKHQSKFEWPKHYLDYLSIRDQEGSADTYANHLRRILGHKEVFHTESASKAYQRVDTETRMTIDSEGLEMFFAFPELGVDYVIKKYETNNAISPTAGVFELLRYGFLAIANGKQGEFERQIRMGLQIHRHGLREHLHDPKAIIRILKDKPSIRLTPLEEVKSFPRTPLHNDKDQQDLFSMVA